MIIITGTMKIASTGKFFLEKLLINPGNIVYVEPIEAEGSIVHLRTVDLCCAETVTEIKELIANSDAPKLQKMVDIIKKTIEETEALFPQNGTISYPSGIPDNEVEDILGEFEEPKAEKGE